MLWLTKGGVLVRELSRKTVGTRVKVATYRVSTGGFHGWLWLDKLRPYRGMVTNMKVAT